MLRRLLSSSSNPAAQKHPDYFATEAHYLSVANRIVAVLHVGGSLVLVTGDPPAVPHLLSQALRDATRSCAPVIHIACRTSPVSEELSRARSRLAAPPIGEATAVSESPEPTSRVFVLADADQLSDQQVRELFESTQNGAQKDTAILLLARSDFHIRFERASLQFLKEQLAGQFAFQEVGKDEAVEFLYHQLTTQNARSGSRGIRVGTLQCLAACVLLLTLGIGAFLFLQYYHFIREPLAGSEAGMTSPRETVVARSTPTQTAGESRPSVSNVPPTSAAQQPAPLLRERLFRTELTPRDKRVTSPADALDPGSPVQASQITLPAPAQPRKQDSVNQQTPPGAPALAQTQSAGSLESMPPDPSPVLELQKSELETASHLTLTPPAPSSMNEHPPPAEIAALVTRGDGFLSSGDITSARLFYERAADVGDTSAALRLGATFDPRFLSSAGLRAIAGDAAQAASWYRRARDLGDTAASDRLEGLDLRAGEPNSSPR